MPHPYTYHIYESAELIAATIETDEPLPHLLVGHQLLLSIDDYSTKLGCSLVIQYVRCCIRRRNSHSHIEYEVHVFCQEQEKNPPL
mgnify:CR=1 FL=1